MKLYTTASIVVAIFAGLILYWTFGAPAWVGAATTLWLAVTLMIHINRKNERDNDDESGQL